MSTLRPLFQLCLPNLCHLSSVLLSTLFWPHCKVSEANKNSVVLSWITLIKHHMLLALLEHPALNHSFPSLQTAFSGTMWPSPFLWKLLISVWVCVWKAMTTACSFPCGCVGFQFVCKGCFVIFFNHMYCRVIGSERGSFTSATLFLFLWVLV